MKLFEAPAYVRFLYYLDSSDLNSSGRTLDSIEERLLNKITLDFVLEKKLFVGDLIRLLELGSQATLHGRMKSLFAMGFIKLTKDIRDSRKKYITPTAKAIKYYEKLSTYLEKALNKD